LELSIKCTILTAVVYNTLWNGLKKARDTSTMKHYKVLWLTTLIRQYMQLPIELRGQFITSLRYKNTRPPTTQPSQDQEGQDQQGQEQQGPRIIRLSELPDPKSGPNTKPGPKSRKK